MPYNYAEQFEQILVQKYETEQKSWRLFNSNPGIGWLNAKTIKLPHITASGYKDHSRTGSFNAGTLTNAWEAKTLAHDRDVEFFIDSMDVDETNLVLSVANITNTFETEQAIPERDCYTFSKLYSEFTTTYSQTADTTALTAANILEKFDTYMSNMDDASVPEEGRILYVTPAVNKLLKEAQGITRFVHADSDETAIRRYVHELDDVEIISVPSARLKTAYNFTTGAVPATADAGALCEMAERGELPDGIYEGPIAFDVAMRPEAAAEKNIRSRVSGDVDLFLVPNIETGNCLGKSIGYFGHCQTAGIVVGAAAPVVMSSRAASITGKVTSIAWAILACGE